ncbi:cyclin-dependent kinase 12 isoform X2 [Cyprinodon tularosa]|uniref:cyclin-dependent kinase 12 isoform X2 n=1 Tax=Cyprinodon tularosa TaxID=77115 RepID=UPI0018E28A47|nr:cyclin-dependent kinase 12 isoform X2 [Cyprinodon tularosa]
MSRGCAVTCVLCGRSQECPKTGTLSTKDQITAHENCLLFASGIFCTSTPQFDDLFGFSVTDVQKEVKRGRKLTCSGCKKKGATAGCEVGRCKRTFHYPCAVEGGAKTFENNDDGKYGLYCVRHSNTENGSSENKRKKSPSFKNPGEVASLKSYCLTCEKKEGNISLDGLRNTIVISYCDKHASSTQQRRANNPSASRTSSSCSSDSSSAPLTSTKRQLSFNEEEEKSPSSRRSFKRKRILSDSSNTDEEGLMPPLESDLEDSVQEQESAQSLLISKFSKNPPGSSAGIPAENVNADVHNEENETLVHSERDSRGPRESGGNVQRRSTRKHTELDAESESLLSGVAVGTMLLLNPAPAAVTEQSRHIQMVETEVQTVKREIEEFVFEEDPVHGYEEPVLKPSVSVPQQSSTTSPQHSKPSSSVPFSSFKEVLPESICVTIPPPPSPSPSEEWPIPLAPLPREVALAHPPEPPSPHAPLLTEPAGTPPSDPKPDIDSASFWRNCNAAGFTEAIFTDFITEINNMFSRIQDERASQEDYDRALSMIMDSGRLADLVTKQEEELERRRLELQRASAALKDVVSALQK